MRVGLAILLALTGCTAAPAPLPPARPLRIVSLDYCADQYVLRLVERDRILAVSPQATRDFSYMRRAAGGVPTVRPEVEDVLVLRPDLVVRTYGGGPGAVALLQRAGVPVLQLEPGETMASLRQTLRAAGQGLGATERATQLAAEMGQRLAALRPDGGGRTALYMTPGGVTSGEGTLIDAMLRTAGFRNYEGRVGWHPLPLEALVYRSPDIVATAAFGEMAGPRNGWSAAHHPVARRQLAARPVVPLDAAWTACGGWFVLDAVEALARAAR